MKIAILIILTLSLLSCNTNVENAISTGEGIDSVKPSEHHADSAVPVKLDSLSVPHELANSPFHKTSSIDYFKKHFKEVTKTEVTLKTNEQDDAITDTIKKLYWGKSYIETINNVSINRILLNYAILNDNNVVLKNNIRIGQTVQEVFGELGITYDSKNNYKYLELETTEDAAGYLTFYFENNKLISVIYSPYNG